MSHPTSARPGEPAPAARSAHRPRLDFVDALRAVAALYVVATHAYGQLRPYAAGLEAQHHRLAGVLEFLFVATLRHGHLAVAFFIVVSGYCLMLPLAAKNRIRLESTPSFLWRRARRILPPYYAALLCTLGLMLAVPQMNKVTTGEWESAQPALTWSAIVSHGLLIHHWRDEWILKISPPLWSIGVEWQIYFLMPLLFLPLWRRCGMAGMLLAVAGLSIVLTFALAAILPRLQTFVHFIALFAAGMAAAWISLSSAATMARWRQHPAWGRLFLGLFALVVILLTLQTRRSLQALPAINALGALTYGQAWVMDFMVAAGAGALMVTLIQPEGAGWRGWIRRALHWRPLVFTGHFSYSLYLIHDPILRLCLAGGDLLRWSPAAQYLAAFALGMPCAWGAGYLLYLGVERHFISILPAHSRPEPLPA